MNGKLAIITAYRALPGAEDVLRLQADCLRRFTPPGDFQVLCALDGLPVALEHDLRLLLPVVVVPMSFAGVSGGAQHGLILDQLVREAVSRGFEWICVLDPDAFPIRAGWSEVIRGWLRDGADIVSIMRYENGDTFLPHPAFTCFPAALVQRYQFSFLPFASGGPVDTDSRPTVGPNGQDPDAGIRLAECIAANQLEWRRLVRTNRRNDHYLLAGVYGDLIFHLGGVARTGLLFRGDIRRSTGLRVYHHYYRLLNLQWPDWRRQKVAALEFLLDATLGFPRRRTEATNRKAADTILARLLEGKLDYVTQLAGGSAELQQALSSERGK
jgi:hypothetical protein